MTTRLPGTHNTKTGRNGTLCSFLSYHPDRLYDLQEFVPFLPRVMPYAQRRPTWAGDEHLGHELPQVTLDALTEAVMQQLEGRPRSNGFIAARCPFPHIKDRPGMHFSYHPESGWGYCFGKHGKVSPAELSRRLGVVVQRQSSADAAHSPRAEEAIAPSSISSVRAD